MEGLHMARAFFVKCRPQDADIKPLVLTHCRVFIGYPPWRQGGHWNRHTIKQAILDLSDAHWDASQLRADRGRSWRQQISQNRWFAQNIQAGDMVVVPRPGEGVCYISRVTGGFELVNDPPWADQYLDLRRKSGLQCSNEADHIADVVQSWPVDNWKKVPFAYLPRWISYRLLSRTTIGLIEDRPDGQQGAADILEQLYNGTFVPNVSSTSSLAEVEARLLDWVSPSTFEHLVVELLQLEHPQMRWLHVGGSGDGGADGLGMDNQGNVVAAVTCKWKYSFDPFRLGMDLLQQISGVWGNNLRVYVAVLYNNGHPVGSGSPNVTAMNRTTIAQLLLKHRAGCAISRSLGIIDETHTE